MIVVIILGISANNYSLKIALMKENLAAEGKTDVNTIGCTY